MKTSNKKFDTSLLRELIDADFDRFEFAQLMGIGEDRLSRLLRGESEFRQSEMISAARILRLDVKRFDRCFFTQSVQKI